jgi:hypothetical protein
MMLLWSRLGKVHSRLRDGEEVQLGLVVEPACSRVEVLRTVSGLTLDCPAAAGRRLPHKFNCKPSQTKEIWHLLSGQHSFRSIYSHLRLHTLKNVFIRVALGSRF